MELIKILNKVDFRYRSENVQSINLCDVKTNIGSFLDKEFSPPPSQKCV